MTALFWDGLNAVITGLGWLAAFAVAVTVPAYFACRAADRRDARRVQRFEAKCEHPAGRADFAEEQVDLEEMWRRPSFYDQDSAEGRKW